MAASFEDFIQSHQFTFFVGEEGKPIVVHAAAIAATSPQLDALINGGMKESDAQCAKIEDVKVDDFIRFCEYAYRGDYTVPPPLQEAKQEEPVEEPSSISDKYHQIMLDDDWGIFGTSSKKKRPKKGKMAQTEHFPEEIDSTPLTLLHDEPELWDASKPQYVVKPVSRTTLRTQFNTRNYFKYNGPKAFILYNFEPKANSGVHENFTPVLLAHARLYCFAHLRLVESLKALTLDKLHRTLMKFKLYTKRVGDIIELARYAYSNPDLPDRGDDGTLNDLKRLVVEYMICEIDTIGKCDEFVKYIEEGGEFVGDFWRMAREYVV